MLLGYLLYGIAFLLAIYIIVNIIRTGKFTVSDAIAFLGIVVSIIFALNVSPNSPQSSDTTLIAGTWTGTITGDTEDFSAGLEISVQASCTVGNVCGTFSVPEISCSGNLILVEITNKTFYFLEDSCGRGSEQITLLSNGTLSWVFQGEGVRSHATLSRK